MPHVNKTPPDRKRIFVQTPFSQSALKFERIKTRRKTTRFFAQFPISACSARLPISAKSRFEFEFKNREKV